MTESQHIGQEDLVLYAMHALPPQESDLVAAHLATCPTCKDDLALLRGDMAIAALSVNQQELPQGAEERFMARIAASAAPSATVASLPHPPIPAKAAEPKVISIDDAPRRRSPWPIAIPWIAAAAATAICISLGIENRHLSQTINSESALLSSITANASRAQQIAEIYSAPHAQRVTLTSTKLPPEPTGEAIYRADRGELLFQAKNLKPLPAGKTYQLWVIPADGKAPVPAGTFAPNNAGYASVVLPHLEAGIAAKAFGVTIENAPGATTQTLPIILSGG